MDILRLKKKVDDTVGAAWCADLTAKVSTVSVRLTVEFATTTGKFVFSQRYPSNSDSIEHCFIRDLATNYDSWVRRDDNTKSQ